MPSSTESHDPSAIPPVSAIVAHLHQLRAAAGEPGTAAEALSAVLIGGRNPAAMARAAGIAIAEEYTVVALSIRTDAGPRPRAAVPPDPQRLNRIREAVTSLGGVGTLPLLGVRGGTVLVPAEEREDLLPPGFLAHLRTAARTPVAAVAVPAVIDAIPNATHLAHELLDIVARLRYPPALYRFEDLTLEYQLTRPGAAADHLSRILEPIVPHPELVKTLRQHIGNNFHRRQTARALNIHSNTVDYRLRRVKDLTGLDPYQLNDLWYLQSALVAHAYARRATE